MPANSDQEHGNKKPQGICRMCDRHGVYAKAHIIPQAFYGDLTDRTNVPHLHGVHSDRLPIRSPIGEYDARILCRCCERELAPIDSHAIATLVGGMRSPNWFPSASDARAMLIANSDPVQLHRFAAFVAWRASISQRPFFHRVNLGDLEARAKEIVLHGPACEDDLFDPIFAVFTDPFLDQTIAGAMLDPAPSGIKGTSAISFYMGKLIMMVRTGPEPWCESLSELKPRANKPLVILAKDLRSSQEWPIMKKTVDGTPAVRRFEGTKVRVTHGN